MRAALELTNVGKRYVVARTRPPETLVYGLVSAMRNLVGRFGGRQRDATQDLWAVRGANLSVNAGETVGIIGRNGAGKSTLLKMLSRVTDPTEGRIKINGRVASLLEVGTGFHPDLSCRQNVYLYGAILGMSRPEIAAHFDSIISFAEVGHAIDEPVKHLSSGMYMRLAFSVAVFLESEILIVDEVLAVGDTDFQRKCIEHIQRAACSGRTVLFVSHDLALVSQLAARTVVIEQGQIVFDGPTAIALKHYLSDNRGPAVGRVGTNRLPHRAHYRAGGAVLIREIGIPAHQPAEIPPGGDVALEMLIESRGSHQQMRILYSVNNALGQSVITGFTPTFSLQPGTTLLEFSINSLKLAPGEYDFTLSVGQGGLGDGKIEYDAYRGVGRLTVSGTLDRGKPFGYWRDEWSSVFHDTASIRRIEPQA